MTDTVSGNQLRYAFVSDAPLFKQIAAMMVACKAAKDLCDLMATKGKGGVTPELAAKLTVQMQTLAKHLEPIDFQHGSDIVAGAAQACNMSQPNVDIICSGFGVGMPQRKDNVNKVMFLKGSIGPDKSAIVYFDQAGAVQVIKELTRCLDILYPQRLVGIDAPPKLIIN